MPPRLNTTSWYFKLYVPIKPQYGDSVTRDLCGIKWFMSAHNGKELGVAID